MKSWYVNALTVAACFLAMCLIIRADGETPPAGKPIGFTPKLDDEDAKGKTIEADVIRAKRIVVKSDDGKATVSIQQIGTKGVGLWVSDEKGSVCLVAEGRADASPYFGTHPAKNDAGGCPLAIGADGTIQLAAKGSVKFLTVAQLLKLAR